jgi:hypothetical protein
MTRRHAVIEETKSPRGIDLITDFLVLIASDQEPSYSEPENLAISRADRSLPFPLSL